MNLIIIRPHNLVVVDTDALNFDLSESIPENLYALQWQQTHGHIEYTDQPNEDITELPDWAVAVVEEHQRLLQVQEQQQRMQAQHEIMLVNGQARKERVRKARVARQRAEQQAINHFVREQMP